MSFQSKFCVSLAALVLVAGAANAVPYASKIRAEQTTFVSGTGTAISYILNEPADSVTIAILSSSTDAELASFAGTTTRGANTVTWDGTANNAGGTAVPAGAYKIVITADKNNTAWAEVSSQRSLAAVTPDSPVYEQVFNGFSPNDGLFVKDTSSDYFGDLYSNSSYGWGSFPSIASVKFNADLSVADGTDGYESRTLRLAGLDGTVGATSAQFSAYVWGGSLDPDSSNILYYTGQTEPTFWFGDLDNPALLQDADPGNFLGGSLPRSVVVVKEDSDKYAYFCIGYTIHKAPMIGNQLSGAPVVVADFTAATRYARQVRVDNAGNLYFVSRALGTSTNVDTGGFGGVLLRWDRSLTLGATPSLTEANATWNVAAAGDMQFMTGPAISPTDGNVYVGFATGSTTIRPSNGVYLAGNVSDATNNRTLSTADRVVDTAAMAWGTSNVYTQLRTDPVGNVLIIDRQREQLRLYTPGGQSSVDIPAPTSQLLTITPTSSVDSWSLY